MVGKILLLGHGKESGRILAEELAKLGYQPMASVWNSFTPRAFGRDRPALVLADTDRETAIPMERLVRMVRKSWGAVFPVIAFTESTRFAETAALLDAGASDCLSKNASMDFIDRKLDRWLRSTRPNMDEMTEEIPDSLLSLFYRADSLPRLGDLVAIHAGATPRRPTWRRLAPPDDDWRGVITSEAVDRFHAGRPDAYLRWSRLALFRLPLPEEYAVAEKVLVRRAGPPLIAAVDRSRSPAGTGVYSLVPREGIPAGFIACLLNSRLLDFYFNRMAATARDGRLRPEDIRSVPVPVPDQAAMQELARTASMLGHFGANPQSWIDRQSRDEWRRNLDDVVFSLYGVAADAQRDLQALHF